jgi:hypothetical protein
VPLERDEQEERLARIQQMLDQVKGDIQRFSESHESAVAEARQTRLRSEEVRLALQKERRRALELEERLAGKKKR